LAFGAWAAAWPQIRSDLALSYVQVGLLLSIPHIFGSVLELPIGLLGDAGHRRTLVRAGGIGFAAGFIALAWCDAFVSLLLALMLISPSAGAFVGLSQATLMDLEPRRHAQNMARWAFAGSCGVVAGPLALGAAGLAGIGWRGAFAALGIICAMLLALVWRAPAGGPVPNGERIGTALMTAGREAVEAIRRRGVVRWLVLLQFSDLMLDVLHGFLALYFVDVAGWSGTAAGIALLVWTGVGLAGDALVIPLLERVEGTRYLRFSACATLVVFPAFLLAPGTLPKLVLLGGLGLLNSGWYAILAGRLYSAMPGKSATVMTLSSGFGILGGLLPLAIGTAAQALGLGIAMWLLLAGPLALLAGLPRRRGGTRWHGPETPPDRGMPGAPAVGTVPVTPKLPRSVESH
jgi:FSR family fosmidomycin resistance protein-like MFS transporter